MNTKILLSYLRAASIYGDACRPVTCDFCKEALGICDVDNAIDQIRALGHQVNVSSNGEIRLGGVQE